ncbi:MAG: tRNA (N6-isopentenyl adenosine(37)-C2)-methylthiotransferase MiaB [Spirochaetes bacterium]|nr:tRNA (N6-isopentenyl adenosine(37)-C2)-methylthiotransferase MiaB [Spirochaetota bacterium]
MQPRRLFVETYGCQMNKAESEAIVADLAAEGWELARKPDDADLVVINTCSVRETAEERIRGRLGWYRRLKRGRHFTLLLTGCMAERLGQRALEEFPEIDALVGTYGREGLREAVRRAGAGERPVVDGDGTFRFAARHSSGGPRAFVPVMHGCDNFCSYCIVPFVRGPEVSRPAAEVLAEVRALDANGCLDVTLLGQNVNSYRRGDGGTITFPRLLGRVAAEAGRIRWIRFLTSHPKDLSPDLIAVMAEEPRLCRHVHLPVQSGSDRVLAAMNRGYTAGGYLRLVDAIRGALTGVSITTDILTGFPGETEEDVRLTLALMERAGFDEAFTYRYNPREGTAAALLGDPVQEPLKLERLDRIIAAQRRIVVRRAGERLGKVAEVLVEGVSRRNPGELLARTEWDAMAVLPGDPSLIGRFVRVRLESLAGATFRAAIL